MTTTDFTTTISVNQTPQQVFDAINNVRGWWSEEIEGSTDKLHDVFNYHYEDLHRSKMKITEIIPDEKIVWLVLDNNFKFTSDKTEWVGTKIVFEISVENNKIQLRFTHLGLVPEYECFEACRNGWTHYIQQSLFNLITTGRGLPNGKGKPSSDDEKKIKAQQN